VQSSGTVILRYGVCRGIIYENMHSSEEMFVLHHNSGCVGYAQNTDCIPLYIEQLPVWIEEQIDD